MLAPLRRRPIDRTAAEPRGPARPRARPVTGAMPAYLHAEPAPERDAAAGGATDLEPGFATLPQATRSAGLMEAPARPAEPRDDAVSAIEGADHRPVPGPLDALLEPARGGGDGAPAGDAVAPAAAPPLPEELALPPVEASLDHVSAPDLGRSTDTREAALLAEANARFAAAIAAAERLQATIAAGGAADAERAATAHRTRAQAASAGLDRDLAAVDGGHGQAVAYLDGRIDSILDTVDTRAAASDRAIVKAAGAASAILGGIAARRGGEVNVKAATADTTRAAADRKRGGVATAGRAASSRIRGLAAAPAAEFPDAGRRMVSATNEAIVERLPARATAEAAELDRIGTAQSDALQPALTKLGEDIATAIASLRAALAPLSTTAPASIVRARSAASAQVDGARRALRANVEQARLQGHAALDAAAATQRAGLVDGARRRADGERDAATARGGGGVAAASGLARAQGAAVATAAKGLGAEHRPVAQAANAARAVADGLLAALARAAVEQVPALGEAAAAGRAGLDAASAGAGAAQADAAVRGGQSLGQAASATGDALAASTEVAAARFDTIPPPVAHAIDGYRAPFGAPFTTKLADFTTELTRAGTAFENAFNGVPGPGPTVPSPPVPATAPIGPASAFQTRAARIAGDPKTDEDIQRLKTGAEAKVPENVRTRVGKVKTGLAQTTDTDKPIMEGLRGLTLRRAGAMDEEFGRPIEPPIVDKLDSVLDAPATRTANIAAAHAYLAGNAAAGARHEMEAAVNFWNDTERIEAAQRALTPAQLDAFRNLPGVAATLADVRGDLSGVDLQVFDALQSVTAADTSGVARADALRLREAIDQGRQERGQAGADATTASIAAANTRPLDVAAGADPLGLDPAAETNAAAHWREIQVEFGRLQPLPDAPAGALRTEGPPDPGAALVAYATAARDYDVGGGDNPVIVHEGIDGRNANLIGQLVRHGEGSPEARAARIAVEETRSGDDEKRSANVRTAMYDPRLNPELAGFNPQRLAQFEADPTSIRLTAAEQGAIDARAGARADRERLFALYDGYTRDPSAPPRDPAAVQRELATRVADSFGDNATGAANVRSLIRDEIPDPVAAFTFAVEGVGTNTDLIKQQFQGMTRSQVDRAVADWDARYPNGPGLYARLGIHGQGNFWDSETSGADAMDIQALSMGVPQNDRERFEVAAMRARLQMEAVGGWGGDVAGDELAAMRADRGRLLGAGGVHDRLAGDDPNARTDFDALGRLIVRDPATGKDAPIGNFAADGAFVPVEGGTRDDLAAAMDHAAQSQAAYVAQTDRVANAITTALVVIAAITTTALTGGAAASIWLPVLLTAGAGLGGIAANVAIKGGRYGNEDMARDFAMTLVQAATAGAGAAAGIALRGGSPALRAAATSLRVAEQEGALIVNASTRLAMRSLSFGEEIALGAGGGALGGVGSAALDGDAWRSGRFGAGLAHGLGRGLLGGAIGAGAMRPFSAVMSAEGAGALTKITARGIGQFASGAATRTAEIGFDQSRPGARPIATGDFLADVGQAGAQNLIQGIGEGVVDPGTFHRPAAAHATAPDALPPLHAAPPPHAAPSDVAAPRPAAHDSPPAAPHAAAEAAPMTVHAEPATVAAAAARDPVEPVVAPRAAAEPDAAPTAHAAVDATPASHPVAPDETPARIAAVDSDSEAARRTPVPAEEPHAAKPAPPEIVDLDAGGDEGMAMMPAEPDDPTALRARRASPEYRADAEQMYDACRQRTPDREAAVIRNRKTGALVVLQGFDDNVGVPGANPRRLDLPGGEGVPQAWKEIVGHDLSGDWELVRHSHPFRGDSVENRVLQRLASGVAGDIEVMRLEAERSGASRASRIDWEDRAGRGHTDIGFDPGHDLPVWIDFEHPATGKREFRRFASVEDYHGEIVAIVADARAVDAQRVRAFLGGDAAAVPTPDGPPTVRPGRSAPEGGSGPAAIGAVPHPPAAAVPAVAPADGPALARVRALHEAAVVARSLSGDGAFVPIDAAQTAAHAAATQELHQLVADLGLVPANPADAPAAQARLAKIMAQRSLDPATRIAVTRAVADARAAALAAASPPPPPGTVPLPHGPRTQVARGDDWHNAEAALGHLRATDPAAAAALAPHVAAAPELVVAIARGRTGALADYEARLIERGTPPAAARQRRAALAGLLGEGNPLRPAIEATAAAARDAAHNGRLDRNATLLDAMDPVLAGFVRANPVASALMEANPGQLLQRFESYRASRFDKRRPLTAETFARNLGRNMAAIALPAVSEPMAARMLAEQFNMGVLVGGPAGNRFDPGGGHAPNAGGIDIVGFRPAPGIHNPEQPIARVEVVLCDDKAHAAGRPSVSALTENLTANLAEQATSQRRALDAQLADPALPSYPAHSRAVEQIEAAAAALRALDASFKPGGGSRANYRRPAYQRRVRAILDQHGITLAVTSAMGGVKAVSPSLDGYGFVAVD